MRLTLRTMLAYLEGVLDATDAEQLAHKIDESEFAAGLMHRTRDVTRRLKLGAPKLDGRGLASDPNTVSEYLDNTLPADRVPEFEKICLESDVHLAEVASVHQILALVLGEQAEFDPMMRSRMYKAVEEADAIEAEAPEPDPMPESKPELVGAGPAHPSKPRRKLEVPDYLREGKEPRNYVPWVLAAAILVCVGAGSVLFVNLGGKDWVLARLDQNQPEVALLPNDSNVVKAPVAKVPGGQAPGDSSDASVAYSAANPDGAPAHPPDVAGTEAVAGAAGGIGATGDSAGPVDPAEPEKEMAQDSGAQPDASDVADAAGPKKGEAATPPKIGSLTTNVPNEYRDELDPVPDGEGFMPDPAPAPITEPAPRPGPPPAADVAADDASKPAPAKGVIPRATVSVLDDDALRPAATPVAPPAAGATAPIVGRLTSDSEVLLRPSGPEHAWTRLSTRDVLSGGNELIALPSFRPSINFNTPGGATAQLLGGTVARLLSPNASGVPGLHLIDGQVVLSTAGRPGTQLQLQVGDKLYLATFVDPDSTLAVDVRRVIPEGGDPIRDPARTTAELYVASGVVDIGPLSGGKHEALTVPDRKTLMGVPGQEGVVNNANATLPSWIVGTTPNPNDKRATLDTEKVLTAGEPVREALEDLTHDRRLEFRNLAVLSLITMGDFEAFLPALNDPMQKANWNAQIDAVRRAIARNHETAKVLKATFEAQRDSRQAGDLYKLLCGVSRQELLAGSDRWLVTELDNDEMDYRVLAFWNLRQVSVGTLEYHPEHNTAKKRAVGVRAWKLRSDARQIVPKS